MRTSRSIKSENKHTRTEIGKQKIVSAQPKQPKRGGNEN